MSVEELRKAIDEVDAELLKLIKRRAELAERVGEVKRSLGLPLVNAAREEEVLSKAREAAERCNLDTDLMLLAFKAIIGLCREAQRRRLTVAFLGPEGSFSEEAAVRAFLASGAHFRPVPTIRDVFRSVEEGDADYGVVPIENSLEGSVVETLDLLPRSKLKVCGEVELRIKLNLIAGADTDLEDVKCVLSHPHALGQCRKFLETTLRRAEVRSCSSTAEAVREAIKLRGAAAIGSEYAATIYGGRILARGIEDARDNFTRFLVVGHKRLAEGKGRKTTVVFHLPNVPGALYKALASFALRNINLTHIESRPVKDEPWEYLFYLDFEGDEEDEACRQALKELAERALLMKVLGSYGNLS